MSTASSTVGRSNVVGTVPVWPPPSPPWIITASAPQAATFSACRAAPTLGITTMPWSLSFAISSCFGASANEATFTPCLISRSTRWGASPASARRFTPNGRSVRLFTSAMAWSSSSKVMVAEARIPSPPALAVPLTRRGPATQPMPVCTTGWRTPASSVSGVRGSCSITGGDLTLAQLLRVEHLPDQHQLAGGGVAGLGQVALGEADLEGRGLLHLLDAHAGVHRDEPHRVAGPAEVEDAEVADDPVHAVEPRRCRSRCLGPRPADTGDDVDLLDEDARGVLGHPVGRLVVHRVARRPADPEKLPLRLLPWADRGDVLVALAIDLGGAHHHVALAVGHDGLEHEPERHPTLDDVLGDPQWGSALQDARLTVGDHQQRVGGVLGQPCAQGRQQAHRAGHHLAVVGEAVGDRDRAVLRPGGRAVLGGRACRDHVAHEDSFAKAATASW